MLWSWLIAIVLEIFDPDSPPNIVQAYTHITWTIYKWGKFDHFMWNSIFTFYCPVCRVIGICCLFFFFYFLHESFWCMCVFEGVWVSRLSWFGCFCWFQFNVFTTFKQMFTSLVLQFLLHLLFRVVFIFVAISSSKYIFLLLLSLLLLLFLFLLLLLYLFVGFIDGGDI